MTTRLGSEISRVDLTLPVDTLSIPIISRPADALFGYVPDKVRLYLLHEVAL